MLWFDYAFFHALNHIFAISNGDYDSLSKYKYLTLKEKMNKALLGSMLCMLGVCATASAQSFTDNKSLGFHERAKLLVSQLTLEEKVKQIGNNVGGINRLGIRNYNYWNEGIHGVARSGVATSFPVSKGLSSTWDAPLMYRVATAISDEARVYNNQSGKGLTYWCPTINLSRDPRWGRDEENYGEDPYLTGILAVQFIKGLQGDDPKYLKTVATAKHFVANNYEKERHSHSSDMDERNLREYYLPAFEMFVKEGRVASIMSAYNALNGVPCCANPKLLTDILREEWGFDGFVTSDCGAIQDIFDNHKYTTTIEEACAKAIKAGEDMNCGGMFQQHTLQAVAQGLLTEADVDSALVRIFESRFRLGEFDDDVKWRNIDPSMLNCKEHQDLAMQSALESIVLLKNSPAASGTPLLPLDPRKTVAIIGPFGNMVMLGGYSGTPTETSTLYEAFARRFDVTIVDENTQFEKYDDKKGSLVAEANGCDGNLGNVKAGDWAMYRHVDFGEDGSSLLIVRSATDNGKDKPTIMKVYLDNMSGTPALTVTLPATGGWGSYVETTFDIDPQIFTGIHDVYMEFSGGNSFCSNMDWFRFDNYVAPLEANIQCGAFTSCNEGSGMKMEGNGNLGYVVNGDWASYAGVDFGNGCDRLSMSTATANGGNQPTILTLYLDSMDGQPAAEIVVSGTGSWTNYQTVEFDVDENLFKGKHTLYVKFTGGNLYCCNMMWMRFYNSANPEIPAEEDNLPLHYTRGCNVMDQQGTNIDLARETAAKVDVVIFTAGTNLQVMDEGHDRNSIALPGDQLKVLKAIYEANPNVILLLESASSLDVTWAQENVPAILEAWYGGQAQGEAIASVLYGEFNPSGKLTSTWYKSDAELGDITDYDIRSSKRTYMYYDKTPLYPFGYGLSYTDFEYSNLSLSTDNLGKDETLTVTFDVKNTGERDGAEVVQLYTHACSAIERPIKELKGFERVELKAGETKTVTLPLRHDQLRYFNPTTHTYDVENGNVDIMVGASSADIRLTDTIKTEGAQVLGTSESITTGIDGIHADRNAGVNTVYRLDGVKMAETDIDSIASGIYVVNGKKVRKN